MFVPCLVEVCKSMILKKKTNVKFYHKYNAKNNNSDA